MPLIYTVIRMIIASIIFCTFNSYAECIFDPEKTKIELIRLAKLQPGGEIYSESSTIHWDNGELATELHYAGCEILKFRITKMLSIDAPLDEKELFTFANKMAMRFWKKEDAYELAVKLSANSFNKEDISDDHRTDQYIMNAPNYAEMLLIYDKLDNEITIEWTKQ